jgi:membrane peptidoglycan carboxypeptidase
MAMANPREPRRITRTIPAAQLIGLLLAFVLTAGAGGVIAAGLVIPLASGVNTAVDTGVEVFEEVPAELVPGPLSEQSQIYASDGKTKLATFYAQNRIVVPLDKVSDNMKNAVISIEDERFYTHGGVDPEGISRAAVKNFGGGDMQGASTLTQQYVKNVLIEEADRTGDTFGILEAREDSLTRKLREAKLAIALEKEMSKDEILQGYLNIAQFGRSVYGVETAARHYFNKSSSDLTVVEAATIAGITKAPSQFDPVENPEKARERRDLVVGKMWQLGYISTEERDEALATKLSDSLNVQPLDVGCDSAKGAAFFCDYVIKEVMASPAFGKTKEDRQDLLYRGGLKIVTTLDIKKQRAAEKAVLDAVPVGDSSGLESAIASVEPGTGKILAMAQNVPYASGAERPSGTTTVNYAADYSHGNSRGFQPGSNFKPFVLAEWLRSGRQLNDIVNANQVSRWPQDFNTPCVGNLAAAEPWKPFNSDGAGSGSMPVLKATYNSVNTAYADMGFKLNLCDLRNTAYKIGYRPTSIPDTNSKGARYSRPLEKAKVEDIEIQAPMILGTQPTSPLNQAAAYATFASGGTYCSPIAILKVKDGDGKEMKVPGANCDKNALPENIANTVTYALENVFTKGTYAGNELSGGRPSAGKTGTTNLSWHTWFTGYTTQLSTSVWVGDAEGDVQHFHTTVKGVYREGPLYGSYVAGPIWSSYTEAASAGMPIGQFGPEDPNLVGQEPAPPKPDNGDEGGSNGGGSGDEGDSGDSGDSDGGGNSGNGNGNGNGGNNGND